MRQTGWKVVQKRQFLKRSINWIRQDAGVFGNPGRIFPKPWRNFKKTRRKNWSDRREPSQKYQSILYNQSGRQENLSDNLQNSSDKWGKAVQNLRGLRLNSTAYSQIWYQNGTAHRQDRRTGRQSQCENSRTNCKKRSANSAGYGKSD